MWRFTLKVKILGIVLLGVAALLLVGCEVTVIAPYELAAVADLPAFLDGARHEAREAYRFAIANPEELTHYPCYCGCVGIGHVSNRDCYIAAIASDGKITFDEHAVGCGICVEITQDVMRLMRAGKTRVEIRAYIDQTYSSRGPGTNTPPIA
jgi:hypothetical protein